MSQTLKDASTDQLPAAGVLGNALKDDGLRGIPAEEWLDGHPALHNNVDIRALDARLHTFLIALRKQDYGCATAFKALVAQAREVEVRRLQIKEGFSSNLPNLQAYHNAVVRNHSLTDHPWIPLWEA